MIARPKRSSASPTAVKYKVDAVRFATHASTDGSGIGRINSDTTLVSSTITVSGSLEVRRFRYRLARGQLEFHTAKGREAIADRGGKIFWAFLALDCIAQDQAGLLLH